MEAKVMCDYLRDSSIDNLPQLLNVIKTLVSRSIHEPESILSDLVDKDLLEELQSFTSETTFYFGKTLRDIKCIITDDTKREHEMFILYKGHKDLSICSMNLPYSVIQDQSYSDLKEVIDAVKKYANSLVSYFQELDNIDRYCTVVEPINPSYKDDYRRIFLDDRAWLHLDITTDGLASNIHLVGQSEYYQDKLQSGLLSWDHDKDVVENIMIMFDLTTFPVPEKKKQLEQSEDETNTEANTCSICLCLELPDCPGVPQPLCQNISCGVYFHRNCLFQWLVACAGGRPPTFGVASGSCPSCLQPISCSEKYK